MIMVISNVPGWGELLIVGTVLAMCVVGGWYIGHRMGRPLIGVLLGVVAGPLGLLLVALLFLTPAEQAECDGQQRDRTVPPG